MRITRDKRKLNQLVDWYQQGDGWICSSYDPDTNAWRETQMPWGWQRWGAVKYPDGYDYAIDRLEAWLAKENWADINYCQAHAFLSGIGVIVEQ